MEIAVFEDDRDIARLYTVVLEAAGHTVRRADQHNPGTVGDADAAVVDLMMPDVDGEQILEWLAEYKPNMRRIAASARFHPSPRVYELAHVVLSKPLTADELLAALQ